MRNIIKTEFLKLKRYSVIKAGIIMTTLSPLLSLFYSTANGGQTWTFDYFMQQVMHQEIYIKTGRQAER